MLRLVCCPCADARFSARGEDGGVTLASYAPKTPAVYETGGTEATAPADLRTLKRLELGDLSGVTAAAPFARCACELKVITPRRAPELGLRFTRSSES